MLKAIMGLAIAGAAALAIASPAAAAPVCTDDDVYAYGGDLPTFAVYGVDTANFCDGTYDIVSVDWFHWGYVYWVNSHAVNLDGIYVYNEVATITVTDGVDTDEFTLTIHPCFSGWYCPPL